jgi:hypothetical protein
MKKQPLFATVTLCALIATPGCATSYLPRAGPRISTVMMNGSLGYVRDGRLFRGGAFGGQLLEAVRGNPEAERHARAFRTGTATGFGLTMAGLGLVLIADAVLIGFSGSGSSGSTYNTLPLLIGLDAGALGLAIAGLFVSMSAQPRYFDAINVYNDGVQEPHFGPPVVNIGPIVPQRPPPPPGADAVAPQPSSEAPAH